MEQNMVTEKTSIASKNSKIQIGSKIIDVTGPITIDLLVKYTKDNGIARFTLEDENGNKLGPSNLPYSGYVKVVEYNAAG